MKKIALFSLAIALAGPLQAQIFNQESLWGAGLGAAAGAVIGNQHHGQSGEGAAIGAGVGWLLGQATHRHRKRQSGYYDYQNGHYYQGQSYPYYSGYNPRYPTYSSPSYGHSAPATSRRPNYALTGAALGGVAGAVIGNQHHGQSGEGAAIGAAAGLLLGGLAERRARKKEQEQAQYLQQIQPRQAAPATRQAAPQTTTRPAVAPIRQQPTSNLRDANRLFGR